MNLGYDRLIMVGASLTIKNTVEDDEAIYFCGGSDGKTIVFSYGTFLAVTGRLQFSISVQQTPASGSVLSGQPVTLQCTVHSDIRAADVRVLWFRSAAGQSIPEIIYTDHNSSSHQREISSSPHSYVYNFSRNILNNASNAGTYYCVAMTSGEIVFSNGTTVDFKGPEDPTLFNLEVTFGVSVIWIFAQAIFIYKKIQCKHCSGLLFTLSESPTRQGHSISTRLRMKRGQSAVYSEVKYFTETDHYQTH
ncbi:uncharacterized protein [Salminus brasiliensis]|uniref:uncharacterized protein n=1 Tax=Salminus brasiliensis TaxID=930266 RepID=UPI003B830B69